MEIPHSLYYLVGCLILANLGTIATIGMIAFRATWWFAKLDSRVIDAKATGVRAHTRIDKIEGAPT